MKTVPRREQIKANQINPGDIIDGQFIGVPIYYRITQIATTLEWVSRARRHLIVDGIPAKGAMAQAAKLGRTIRAIARMAARQGMHVSVHAPSSLSGRGDNYDFGELRAVLWLTIGSQVQHEITVTYHGNWQYRDILTGKTDGYWRSIRRADCLMRALPAKKVAA